VTDRSRARLPWLVVAGSAILAFLFLYVLFAAYMPAKQRVARLEAELKEVYAREAALQTKAVQQEGRMALRDQQLKDLAAQRDALARQLEEARRTLSRPAARR
jgi:type II secretory pathway component PulM